MEKHLAPALVAAVSLVACATPAEDSLSNQPDATVSGSPTAGAPPPDVDDPTDEAPPDVDDPDAAMANGADAGACERCDGDTCVDLETDGNHCGACGQVCETSADGTVATCEAEQCVVSCEDGYGDCDSEQDNGCEVSLDDVAHCGACDNRCEDATRANAACVMGACTLVCEAGYGDCDGDTANGCETDLTLPGSCGTCGTVCAGGSQASPVCRNGACALACDADHADCDGNADNGCEADLATVATCGSCGVTCSAASATATCDQRQCSYACVAGYGDCDSDTANGCETALDSPSHCGACGTVCAAPAQATATCDSGACGFACAAGFADCNGLSADGCEVDLTSPSHCGGCGAQCVYGNNSSPVCTGNGCGLACDAGYADCDGSAATGCEQNLSSVTSCGACGTACPSGANATATCDGSQCGHTCDAGYADCNGTPSDGCEVDLASLSSCGACGRVCTAPANAAATCDGVSCGFSCQAGYADCNGDAADGCEVDLSDLNHCGACNAACPSGGANVTGATCAASTCGLSCDAGYADCNGNLPDGCEADLAAPQHCGACGNVCGASTPHCIQGACTDVKTVFITSVHVAPGTLGGRSGADAHCQSLANAAGLSGTFMAWLSDASGSPSSLFTRSTDPYVLVDGTIVANNWADLTDRSLDNPIMLTETGQVPARVEGHASQLAFYVATNTLWTGQRYVNYTNQTCNNFTSTSSTVSTARPDASDVYWTQGWTGGGCDRKFAFYCFEQ